MPRPREMSPAGCGSLEGMARVLYSVTMSVAGFISLGARCCSSLIATPTPSVRAPSLKAPFSLRLKLNRHDDPGEKPLGGSLLWTRHGKGTFVYTGLAFFRQLPAGVPGAYRLFANLLASGRRGPAHGR